MKVFVIGGSGFLGSHLVPKLVRAGHDVTVLTRRESEMPRLADSGARPVHGDILDCETFLPALPKQDVVVFIAMPFKPGRISGAKLRALTQKMTLFGKNALTVATRLGATLIFTRGTSYRTAPGEVADETWPFCSTGVARIGDEAGAILHAAFERGEPPLIMMLPGQIYGPGGTFQMMIDMMKSGRFRVIGSGENRIPRVHVEDCAEAYALAVEKRPIGETFIIADDLTCTAREFADRMAECLGKPRPGRIPGFVVRLVMGKVLYETIMMDCVVSNAKAKRVLGWQLKYPTFSAGLAATFPGVGTGLF